MTRGVMLTILGIAITGCSGDVSMTVDVITDWSPGTEFAAVRTVVRSEAGGAPLGEQVHDVTGAEAWLSGARVAELGGIGEGPRRVEVTLEEAGGARVAGRELVLELTQSYAALVVITRSCRDVTCPDPEGLPGLTVCQSGRCVDPRCSPAAPEYCPGDECSGDGDCGGVVGCMTTTTCIRGSCLCTDMTPISDAGMDTAAECSTDLECGEPTTGMFGACDWAGTCDESAERSRDVMTPRCVSGRCMVQTSTETEPCDRDTDGTSCGMTTTGSWGACGGFADMCDTTGTQSRDIDMRTCMGGSCRTDTTSESRSCTRSTEGTSCGASYLCCGGVCHDIIFNFEHCGACNVACDYPTYRCVSGGPTGLACECGNDADCAGSTGNCSGGLCVP